MKKIKNPKIALIQMAMSSDKKKNIDKALSFIAKAKQKGADIVCLPELFTTLYFCQSEDKSSFNLAEEIPGPATEIMANAAKEHEITLIAGSIFEKGKDRKFYNTSTAFSKEGKMIGRYSKVHIPYDPGFYERTFFTGGKEYSTYDTEFGKFSTLICWDQWFPEAARINTLRGAKLIFYPTAIGWIESMRKMEPFSQKRWEQVHCSHASVNGIFVAAVNRVGNEGKTEFWGNSLVADPFGNVIARASSDKEEILFAELDLSLIESSQKGWGFLKGRRPDTY